MRKRVAQCSSKVSVKKFMNKWEKKDLETLADDFGLLQRNDVQEIIQNCKTYAECNLLEYLTQ